MSAKPKPLILIVEDEKDMAAIIAEQLELADMIPQVFHRAAPALRYLSNNFANLMLLDVNLPDQSGFSLMEELKHQGIVIPIIFLTGDSSEFDKVKGLEMGGDDYITKPFSFPELIARMRAVLRRTETAHDFQVTNNASIDQGEFTFCGAVIHPTRMEISFPNGKSEKIGRKELGIFAYLFANPGSVITRRSLIHAVWGIHADIRSRSLDQYIVKIRNLFERHACSMECFRTIHGVGYIFEPESRA
jgi:two-component system alkaline phosphatase synthesis response regulator PhoP